MHLRLRPPREVQVLELLLGREQLLAELAVGALELGAPAVGLLELRGAGALRVEGAPQLVGERLILLLEQRDRLVLGVHRVLVPPLLLVQLLRRHRALARRPLDRLLELVEHRRLLRIEPLEIGHGGLRLRELRAHLLRRLRQLRILLARASELQLGEAALVAQLDHERLHRCDRGVAIAAATGRRLRALALQLHLRRVQLGLGALQELVQPHLSLLRAHREPAIHTSIDVARRSLNAGKHAYTGQRCEAVLAGKIWKQGVGAAMQGRGARTALRQTACRRPTS